MGGIVAKSFPFPSSIGGSPNVNPLNAAVAPTGGAAPGAPGTMPMPTQPPTAPLVPPNPVSPISNPLAPTAPRFGGNFYGLNQ